MERLTYVTEDGEVLFHPEDLPEDVGMTITQLAKDGRYKALEEIAERLANREQAEEQGLHERSVMVLKYTEEQFAKALEVSAKQCGLNEHVSWLNKKSDMNTWADRIIGIFFRKGMPIKRSYMMCDALDMTFFFLKNGEAAYTYSGYADKRDATEEKIVNAFKKANKMRMAMEQALKQMGE